jgi:hypothetical protein
LHIGLIGTRELTWRRFSSLLTNLPVDSAFKVEFIADQESDDNKTVGNDISRWTLTNQLLANMVDILALANYQRGGGKGSKPKLLTSAPRRSTAPAEGIDVRDLLEKIGPAVEQESEEPE